MPKAATHRYDWVAFSAASPSPAGTRVTHNRLVYSSLLPAFESLYVCGVSEPRVLPAWGADGDSLMRALPELRSNSAMAVKSSYVAPSTTV
jgi:hypothetical protein